MWSCNGIGIYKGFAEKEDLGILCTSCCGKGYQVLELNEEVQLVKDENTNEFYLVENGHILYNVKLFDKLQIRDDVYYVIYSCGKTVIPPEYLFENGANEINVITYKEFLNGIFPLPIMKYTCPSKFSQSYFNESYNCEGRTGWIFFDCQKFGKKECWDNFYGDAKTIEEKQKVLETTVKHRVR